MNTAPVPRGLVKLSVDECLELLGRSYLGRLAFIEGGKPQLYPLNYRFHEGTVVFRTGWGRLLDAVHGQPVVFEIDGVDDEYHAGWSVAVHGRAEELWRPEELESARRLPLRPWAPGDRDHYVRIDPTAMTGRRIV